MDADQVTRFARVDFRGDDRVFGIRDEDRFSHVYVIGKTGTGKSTLLENMALQDLEHGHGFALIDPHGDLVGRVAARAPASGRHDVIYLDATDPKQPHADDASAIRRPTAHYRHGHSARCDCVSAR